MARVHAKTRQRATKRPYVCGKCGQEIVIGQDYYEWSFRYGGTHRRHATCGHPRQSELTQSKMGQVYAAMESLEDSLMGEFDPGDIEAELQSVAEQVREVASEYEEAAEPFGNQGENQERYESLDAFADQLDDASYDLPERENEGTEDEQEMDEWRDAIRTRAQDALGECPY